MRGVALCLAAIGCLAVANAQTRRLVYDVAVSPDDRLLAVTIGDDAVRLYRLSDGKLERTLRVPKSSLVDLEFSPDGSRLACGDQAFRNGVAPIWDTKTWRIAGGIGIARTPKWTDPAAGIEYAGGGRWLLGQPRSGRDFAVWDAATGRVAFSPRSRASGRYRFAVTLGGTLAAMGENGTPRLRFWDFGGGDGLKVWGAEITEIVQEQIRYMRFSNDGQSFGAILQPTPDRAEVYVYRADGGRARLMTKDAVAGITVRDMEWSPDGRALVLVGLGGRIVRYDARSAQVEMRWTGHGGGAVKAVSTARRGQLLITGGDNVCVWDTRTGRLVRRIVVR